MRLEECGPRWGQFESPWRVLKACLDLLVQGTHGCKSYSGVNCAVTARGIPWRMLEARGTWEMGGACLPSSYRLLLGRFWVLRVGMASSSGLATAGCGEFLSPTNVSFDPVCPSSPFSFSFRSLISPIFFFLSDIFLSVQGTQAPFFLCVVPTLDFDFYTDQLAQLSVPMTTLGSLNGCGECPLCWKSRHWQAIGVVSVRWLELKSK